MEHSQEERFGGFCVEPGARGGGEGVGGLQGRRAESKNVFG